MCVHSVFVCVRVAGREQCCFLPDSGCCGDQLQCSEQKGLDHLRGSSHARHTGEKTRAHACMHAHILYSKNKHSHT